MITQSTLVNLIGPKLAPMLVVIGATALVPALHFDALGMHFRETRLTPDPGCPVCAPGAEFPGYIDYEAFCAG